MIIESRADAEGGEGEGSEAGLRNAMILTPPALFDLGVSFVKKGGGRVPDPYANC